MSFVVYHKDTTRFLRNHPKVKTDRTSFTTKAAARAALTREVNGGAVKREDFLIADGFEFWASIEKKETVTMHGNGTKPTAPYQISINTPMCMDPRSETYWSM
jgi:hypothetical protein